MKKKYKAMQCPRCGSTHLRKNGIKQGKQNHICADICADCGQQFIDEYAPRRTYSAQMKQECLQSFIDAGDHIISKTYMIRVEGETTRLRHYLARLHRKTLCYSKSVEMLKHSIRLLLHYLKFRSLPLLT